MSMTAAKAIKAVIRNKDVGELLSEDASIFGIYQDAYHFIVDYYGKHSTVPSTTLLEDQFGDDLFDEVPEVDGATRHYLNELRNDYLRTNIEEMLLTVSKNIDKRSPSEVLDKMASKVSELSKHTTRIQDVDITDIDAAVRHFQQVRENAATGTQGIMTGIEVWDEYAPTGLLPGQNIVLFGYSGRAKSWIADLIAANAYRQGKKVLFVSLEMSEAQQRDRIFSILGKGKFAMGDLQRGNVFESDLRNFGDDVLHTGGKIIVAATDGVTEVTPNVIRAKIEKHKPDLVIVDYLQLMRDNGKSREMTQRMLNLSGEMKRLAVMANVPVITISAVTDDEGKKRNSPPMISQLAWSRAIEYDADMAVAVHKYDGTRILELACRKHRNGDQFNLRYEVDLGHGLFIPLLDGEDEED